MTEQPDVEWANVTVTCHTDGCDNAGISIELQVPSDPTPPNVVCGVCNEPISDIKPTESEREQ